MIEERVEKAANELKQQSAFDHVVVNDALEDAILACQNIVKDFIT
jgi:guanylate kinase